jgi:hypothetical protein
MAQIQGTVTTVSGEPLSGVMVVSLDLNYAETDAAGNFCLKRPDMAVLFWHTGFRAHSRVVGPQTSRLNIVLQKV